MNTNKIYTEVIINARIQDVWSVLIDTEKYANWNPLIVHSEGTIKIGKKIKNTLKSGKKTMVFKPTIKQFEPNSCFAWLGHLWFPGIFDGYHSFRLEKTSDNSTKLIHEERFTGLLAGIILKSIKEDTIKGFQAMNLALKKKVESN